MFQINMVIRHLCPEQLAVNHIPLWTTTLPSFKESEASLNCSRAIKRLNMG
jgi:hypothetical protein